jgi:hypothetical protein
LKERSETTRRRSTLALPHAIKFASRN